MMTLADRSMLGGLKKIWKECFGDEDSYIDLFFKKRFVPEDTLVYVLDGSPVSMLFMLPVSAETPDKEYRGRYRYAVATLPSEQKKGFSTELLNAACEETLKRKEDFAILCPASESLADFYEKRGFSRACVCKRISLYTEGAPLCRVSPARLEDCAGIRDSFFRDSSFYVRWDGEALRYQNDEVLFNGGSIFLLEDENGNTGYAVCIADDGLLVIKEMAGGPDPEKMIKSLLYEYQLSNIVLYAPEDAPFEGRKLTRGMVRFLSCDMPDLTAGTKPPYIGLVLD